MPKALVINPNTSEAMTAEIARTARQFSSPPGPASSAPRQRGRSRSNPGRIIALAGLTVLPLLQEHPDADGVVLACFGDPGLYLLKRCSVPVVGIAEAAMSLALLLGASGSWPVCAGRSS